MIGFKCPCGFTFEATGDPAEVYDVIDDHEQFCPMNEISSEHPAKNRIGADREQSNNLQGVEMLADKTTTHSIPETAEIERLRTVRAVVVESRDRLDEARGELLAQRNDALAANEWQELDSLLERLEQQIQDQRQMIATYDRKIAAALEQRDYPHLKAIGWEETPSCTSPGAILEGPTAADDSESALAYFAWTSDDGTIVTIDTIPASGQLTLAQAQQFARRLLSQAAETQQTLEPTTFCIDTLDHDMWVPVERMRDDVTTYRRTWLLPHGARAEIDLDPRDGDCALGRVSVIGLEDVRGVDALEETALDLLDFVDDCRSSRTAASDHTEGA